MVSPSSPPNPSILHQFLMSNSISNQTQFESQNFDAFGVDLRCIGSYPHSIGVYSSFSRQLELSHAPPMAEEEEEEEEESGIGHRHQRLSLSLGFEYRQRSLASNAIAAPHCLVSGSEAREGFEPGNYSFAHITSANQSLSDFCRTEPFAMATAGSRYLRPAQNLLDEVVSVGGSEIYSRNECYVRKLSRSNKRGSLGLCSELNLELSSNVLSMEKQAFQSKLAKLIVLLEQVERRYEQYFHRLEEVVSSFEAIAGVGAGNTYTALALQAMSKHFCSLRDTIVSQIYATRKKLLQDFPRISTGFSKLSLFDGENMQSRVSLQQLGLIPSVRPTWRPIRGLPETSVSILRSWLFEHFLHPYPNDSEKLMLASQTGLSKNQVSNWFINARVRLWKPMIEEMYKEEFAELSEDSISKA